MKALHRVVLTALAAACMLFPAGGSAWALDDFLESSDPAPGQELKQVPGWVTLVFREDSDRSLAALVVLDADGQSVTTGPLIVEGTNVTTQLRSGLKKGTYTVIYRTVDEFGEKRGGSYQFAYGKGDWTPVENEVWQGESAEPTILQDLPEESQTPSATPSETPSESATPTPSAMPTPTPTPTASAAPVTPANPGDSTGWLLGGGAVVLALAGGGGFLAWRRRQRERG